MTSRVTPTFFRRYEPGQTIIHVGGFHVQMFQLESGLVRVIRFSARGQVFTQRLVFPGDYFGEGCLTDHRCDNEAVALSNSMVRAVDPETISAQESQALCSNLAQQLDRVMNHAGQVRHQGLRERVAWYLLELAETSLGGTDLHGRTFVTAAHQLICDGIRARRESVSKMAVTLSHEHLLVTGCRRFTLLDPPALERISGWTRPDGQNSDSIPDAGGFIADAPRLESPGAHLDQPPNGAARFMLSMSNELSNQPKFGGQD